MQSQRLAGRYQGCIKWCNADKGFGFIECPEIFVLYHRDVFLHRTQIGSLKVGNWVTFVCEPNKENMPQAKDVLAYGVPPASSSASGKGQGKGNGKGEKGELEAREMQDDAQQAYGTARGGGKRADAQHGSGWRPCAAPSTRLATVPPKGPPAVLVPKPQVSGPAVAAGGRAAAAPDATPTRGEGATCAAYAWPVFPVWPGGPAWPAVQLDDARASAILQHAGGPPPPIQLQKVKAPPPPPKAYSKSAGAGEVLQPLQKVITDAESEERGATSREHTPPPPPQQPPRPAHSSPRVTDVYANAGEATALLQQQPKAPEIFDSPYRGRQSEHGGVIGTLAVVESDFARLLADIKAAEATAQKEYETFTKDSKVDKGSENKDVECKPAKKRDEEQALTVQHVDLEAR